MASEKMLLESQHIESFLRRLRRRFWFLQTLQALVTATLSLALWLVLIALLRGAALPASTIRVSWWVGVAGVVGYLCYRIWRLFAESHDQVMVERLEGWVPETKGFLSALELGRVLPSLDERPMFSESLARARVQQVHSAVHTLRPAEVVPTQRFRRRAKWLLSSCGVFFIALAIFPYQFSAFFHQLLYAPHKLGSPALMRDLDEQLVVADIEVRYHYPSYTRLSPRTIPNSDGNLSALKGTQAHIKARALVPLRRAEIVLQGNQRVTLQLSADRRSVSGQIPILRAGFYRFQLFDTQGNPQLGAAHTIQLQRDLPPRLKIIRPKHMVERRERETLTIDYQASDDFGITELAVVYKIVRGRGKEKRYVLKRFRKPQRRLKREIDWDLSTTPFSPGDKVRYQLEVVDNDVITGPKRTRSEARFLKIYSPQAHHAKMLARQEQLLDKMILFLGDLLERPKSSASFSTLRGQLSKLNSRGQRLVKEFEKLQEALKSDPLVKNYTVIALENLRHRFRMRHSQRQDLTQRYRMLDPRVAFARPFYSALHREETPPQEDDVYAMSLLLNRQRLDMLERLSRRLNKSQNRLQELLDKYRKDKSTKTKQALLQEMRRVERLIKEIQRRMQKLSRQIPDEYLNMSAFRRNNGLKQLKKMRKAVQQDKLADAAKRLSRLARSVERMVSQMDRYRQQAGGSTVNRMAAAMKRMLDKLHQLEQKQRRLGQRTQQLRQQVTKRMQQRLKAQSKKVFEKQRARLKQIRRLLKQAEQQKNQRYSRYRFRREFALMKESSKQVEQLLKMQDVFESLRTTRQLNNQNLRTRLGMQMQRRQMSLLEQLMQRQSQRREMLERLLSPEIRAKRKRERELRRKMGESQGSKFKKGEKEIGQSMKKLQQAQKLGDAIIRDLERFMPSLKQHLTPQEQHRMQRYGRRQRELRQQGSKLQKHMQRMGKRMPVFKPGMLQKFRDALQEMRGASKELRGGSPRPAHHHQQKAASKLSQLRKQMQKMMQSQQQKGRRGKRGQRRRGGGGKQQDGRERDQNKVKIPDADKHKAPKALRQDILKAMKEKLPRRYQDSANRYYEKLVK